MYNHLVNQIKSINYNPLKLLETLADNQAAINSTEYVNYGQLYAAAQNLAQQFPVAPSEQSICIGVTGQLGIATIVALVAIVLSGNHYVYVDAKQPVSWLEQQLKRLDCRLILSGSDILPGNIPKDIPLLHFNVDTRPTSLCFADTPASHAAYVNFSSGSTGEPKAIVGILLPNETFDVLSLLRHEFPDVEFEYHVHNDRGLALANTLNVIQAGVNWHSTSCNGIGERAGITDTFQLITLLATRFEQSRFNITNILAVSELTEAYSRIPVSPMQPVVGKNAFVHVARLHQLAMQQDSAAYSIFDPERINNRVSLERFTPLQQQELFLTPFEKSATELKYHRHGPGKRFVMLDKRLVDGSLYYFIARQFSMAGADDSAETGHVDSHIHNCDSVFLFLGDGQDYAGLEVEVDLGGEIRRLHSPSSVFIPAGVAHSYRFIRGCGTYINFVHKGDYHDSLLEITQ
ncbi:AMP-binding protein [Serratia silvae]